MEQEQVIFEDDEYHIVRKSSFSEELIDVFDRTSWGETGALYEHKDTRARLEELKDPILLEVRKDDDLVGCCVLVGRTTYADSIAYLTYYVRYLVANPKFKGKGLMTKYAIHTMDSVRKGALPRTLFVGVVEKFNKKSYNLVRAVAYEDVSTIKTMSYSRLFPKKDPRVQRATTAGQKEKIIATLNEQYSNHSLYHQENIFHADDYYYIEEDGQIIAGVQVFPALWVINKLPGKHGKLIMLTLPYIPLLNKMFNPRKFQFLAFEGIIYQPYRIKDLHRLFSHVLTLHSLKTALYWLDEKSKLSVELENFGKLGLLQKMGAASDASIMISFTDVAPTEKDNFTSRPTYQSGFDFI